MTVRTRFAPSPTGYLHIGGARTALFSWLYARKLGGSFVLRIEDTDRERSTEESVQAILDGMAWLGLNYDEGPIYQSSRYDRYREVIQQLLDAGQAYYCYTSKDELDALREHQQALGLKPKYDGRYRDYKGPPRAGVDPVIRFKNPLEGAVVIDDLIRGKIVVSNAELDDLIIARADGTPTYNFTVVVDDLDMAISHVIRGDDHINNTPRQINIMRALDREPPQYAHVPMILGADGKRLSKRHGAVSVTQYREDGYLPEALLNYLVRLGWSHGDQEVFRIDEMIEHFSLSEVNKAASTFNPDKLLWLNHHYLKTLDPNRLATVLRTHILALGLDPECGPDLLDVVAVMRDRAHTLVEMAEATRYLFVDAVDYDPKAADKHLIAANEAPLMALEEALGHCPWERASIHAAIAGVCEALGLKLGKVGPALRVALTGTTVSPSLDDTVYLIGRERVLARLNAALSTLRAKAARAE